MTDGAFSIRRTLGLTRWNATLLARNRLAAFYATVMPFLGLGLLLTGDSGSPTVGASAIITLSLVVALFPIYYNVLSQFVSRRDELVLKRMRTGEARDAELLVSIAMPGALIALALYAIAVPVAAALGQSLPVNPVVYAASAVLTIVMFAAFAYWTAAWTRSAEAAQLTSMPIIILAAVGPLLVALPGTSDGFRDAVSLTPGAAMLELVRTGWFGLDGHDAKESTLTLADTWTQAGGPLLVIAAWTIIAVVLARRSMHWEPRT